MAQIRIPHPWDPGYALPQYVRAEPDGRGTFTSKYLPRRTFFPPPKPVTGGYAVPKYVQEEPIERGTFTTKYIPRRTINTFAPDMLQRMGSLGADEAPKADPIQMYGTKAAEVVLVEMDKVPPKDRPLMMKRVLDGVDPALVAQVNRRLKANQAKGMPPRSALRSALEESFKEGLTREFARIGRGQSPKRSGAVATGLGLDIGGSIKGIFSGHVKAAKKIGGVACEVARHPATGLAAGAGAAAYGTNPDNAVAGAAIAASACGPGYAPGAEPGFPWIPVLAVGGAAVVAVLILTRD